MTKYHVNPETGRAGRCSADPSNPNGTGCDFLKQDPGTPHFDTVEDAKDHAESLLTEKHSVTSSLSKPKSTTLAQDFNQLEQTIKDQLRLERDIDRLSSAEENDGRAEVMQRRWEKLVQQRTDLENTIMDRDDLDKNVDIIQKIEDLNMSTQMAFEVPTNRMMIEESIEDLKISNKLRKALYANPDTSFLHEPEHEMQYKKRADGSHSVIMWGEDSAYVEINNFNNIDEIEDKANELAFSFRTSFNNYDAGRYHIDLDKTRAAFEYFKENKMTDAEVWQSVRIKEMVEHYYGKGVSVREAEEKFHSEKDTRYTNRQVQYIFEHFDTLHKNEHIEKLTSKLIDEY